MGTENRISTIEGNSFSGKTTIVKKLGAKHGFATVWEPMTYVGKPPNFPPETYSEAKRAIDIFAEVEKKRSTDALNLLEQSDIVVMDRSLWTYAAFQYVVMKHMPFIPNSYLYSLDILQKHLENEEIVAPGAMVNLSPVSHKEFQNRVATRGRAGIGFLNDWKTTLLMQRWFDILINCAYTRNNGVRLVTGKNTDDIALEVNDFLRRSEYFVNTVLAFNILRTLK